jgi:hypothetical protein
MVGLGRGSVRDGGTEWGRTEGGSLSDEKRVGRGFVGFLAVTGSASRSRSEFGQGELTRLCVLRRPLLNQTELLLLQRCHRPCLPP